MKRTIATFAILAGMGLTMPPSTAAEFELKISTMFPSTHFIQTLAMEPWAIWSS